MTNKNIPFNFVFDYLMPLDVTVKPMFGLYAIYVNEKIMLVLRERKDHEDTKGVWVATNKEHHKSLKSDLPSLRSIYSKAIKETEWQLLPVDSDEFEAAARKVCDLIKRGDPRIGRYLHQGKAKQKPGRLSNRKRFSVITIVRLRQ